MKIVKRHGGLVQWWVVERVPAAHFHKATTCTFVEYFNKCSNYFEVSNNITKSLIIEAMRSSLLVKKLYGKE